ncbi:MAG: hypothetical protein ABIQ30_10730 [Devosia sp.]
MSVPFPAASEHARPRLDHAWANGPVPNYSPTPIPPPEPPPPSDPLDALYERLHTALLGCFISINSLNEGAFPVVAHNELALLNADLTEASRLNATLPFQQRSLRVERLSEPALPPTRLHGHRDALPFIETALRIVSSARARRPLWLAPTNPDESLTHA